MDTNRLYRCLYLLPSIVVPKGWGVGSVVILFFRPLPPSSLSLSSERVCRFRNVGLTVTLSWLGLVLEYRRRTDDYLAKNCAKSILSVERIITHFLRHTPDYRRAYALLAEPGGQERLSKASGKVGHRLIEYKVQERKAHRNMTDINQRFISRNYFLHEYGYIFLDGAKVKTREWWHVVGNCRARVLQYKFVASEFSPPKLTKVL